MINRQIPDMKAQKRNPNGVLLFSSLAFCPAANTTSTGKGAKDDQNSCLAFAISEWIPTKKVKCPVNIMIYKLRKRKIKGIFFSFERSKSKVTPPYSTHNLQ